ncbi:MAG: SLBB domain-containing protein [Pyrinomonadaceae bacterium]|nr:SLBB domain-containing protein [Acidobacteriota bacterium]MBP7375466.1 SLBB domain-containing protein [Pyrinomonadaceae bacterium]
MKLQLLFCLTVMFAAAGLVLAQVPVDVASDQKGYMIGPGDEITGKVLGEPQYDFVATVDEDGKIEVPFFDKPVVAKCRSERELRTDVTNLLAKYLRNPQASIRVTDRKSRPPATIYGEVEKPQQIELRRKATLVELLAFSGGIKEEAGGMIQVFRTRPPMCTDASEDQWKATTGDPTDVPSRMYSLSSVRMGKEEANPIIYPGDVIVVQKAAPVYVTGEVVAPQGIYLKEGGMSLTEAIAKIGGVRPGAKTKDIKIYRYKSNTKDKEVISANLDQIKKGTQKDIMLEPYDIVEVDKAKESIAATILKMAMGVGKTVVSSGASSFGYRILY